ncbi:cwf21 domain-containing protein [Pholiota molesta]|nr:cwf21 domain-containing protein [Pholiota molesta]
MYNGIGLTTPRGSGTSGYVVRNLSTLRVHERTNDKSAWDTAPPKHREPDEAILEHERKRKVEVKCLELQDELEEKGLDESEIEAQVDQLRQKLLANLSASALPTRGLKPSDTHGMAAAKKAELSKMARALGTRADYQEGEAFDREKQEENRIKRIAEREERERSRAEHKAKMTEQKAKWEEERKERDRLRQKEEEKRREERAAGGRDAKAEERGTISMPPPRIPTGPRREYQDRDRPSDPEYRNRSPPRRAPPPPRDDYRGVRDGPRRMDPPPPRGEPQSFSSKRERSSRSPSRSPSPPPRNRRRVILVPLPGHLTGHLLAQGPGLPDIVPFAFTLSCAASRPPF